MGWTNYSIVDEGTINASTFTFEFNNATFEHKIAITQNTTITIDCSDVTPLFFKRRIRIVMPATVYSVTFPSTVKWNRGFAPCMNVPSHEYLIELETYDGGQNWCGSWVCEMEA